MPPERPQLLLPFPYEPGYDVRDFVAAASNRQALAWLDADWPDRRLALWGPAGCGKSHLLHVWAERSGARIMIGQTLHDLDSVPESGALALDNADQVTPEPLLLHLLNMARDRGQRVLLAARTPPSRWPVRLADLSSRLRAVTVVGIEPPGDDLLAPLLMRLLSDRQLSVPQSVQDWLAARLPRSPAALRQAVLLLDRASLATGKPITRSLAARTLFAAAERDEVSMSDVDPTSESPGVL
jgi:chromosomal replication initiation ATPase DnaA